jgi:hypothetical protein
LIEVKKKNAFMQIFVKEGLVYPVAVLNWSHIESSAHFKRVALHIFLSTFGSTFWESQAYYGLRFWRVCWQVGTHCNLRCELKETTTSQCFRGERMVADGSSLGVPTCFYAFISDGFA